MHKNINLLVTGASGMVGKSLVKKLNKIGFSNLRLPSSKELDLLEQQSVENYFNENIIDIVIHLAGTIGGINDSIKRPVEFMYDNLTMAMNIIKISKTSGIKRLLCLGSSCIYPVNSKQPMKEEYLLTGPFEPTNEGYSIAKISAIKLCEYMNKQFGLEYFSLIPPNLFGPNDNFNPETSHVMSSLINKFHSAKKNKKEFVEVWGSGKSEREFLYVDDLSDAIIFFMDNYDVSKLGSFVNVGSNRAISIHDLSFMVKEVIGYEGYIKFNPDLPDGMPKKLMDSSIANGYGWNNTTDLLKGIKLTYNWYKNL